MFDYLRRTLARPLVALWLASSRHSWKRRAAPHDSPHVKAPGVEPDRVLVAGDGAASGRGVSTHELGLSGFLARSLSARTGRATEVDILVDDDMTVMNCTATLLSRDLDRYDIVVLSTGANEALSLLAPSEWQIEVHALISSVRLSTPPDTMIFVLAIPTFGVNPHFPKALASAVDYNAGILNTITEQVADDIPGVVFVPDGRDQVFEDVGAILYHRWADRVAERIALNLDPDRPHAADTADRYEVERQGAVERLESFGTADDAELDRLTDEARRRFGVDIAAVTFLRRDTEHVRAASGFETGVRPRSDAICDLTIRRRAAHIVEDLALDHRYARFSIVQGRPTFHFYAGFPIESPDGYRVGALCVVDQKPRRFSESDAAELQTIAQRIQRHLYSRENAAV